MQHENENNTVMLLATLFQAICAFAAIFLNCELGERTMEAFEGIVELSTQLDWYLFPLEIKQILPMALVNVQQPIEFACFGSRISCSRESFKKVRCVFNRSSFCLPMTFFLCKIFLNHR